MGVTVLPEMFAASHFQLDYYSIGPEGCCRQLSLGWAAEGRNQKSQINGSLLQGMLQIPGPALHNPDLTGGLRPPAVPGIPAPSL